MPNLNFETAQEIAQEIAQETVQEKIRDLILITPNITRNEIANRIKLSSDQVKRLLDKMKKDGIIHHEGSTKSGYWVIDK